MKDDSRIYLYAVGAIVAGIFAGHGFVKGDLADALVQLALLGVTVLAGAMTTRQKLQRAKEQRELE